MCSEAAYFVCPGLVPDTCPLIPPEKLKKIHRIELIPERKRCCTNLLHQLRCSDAHCPKRPCCVGERLRIEATHAPLCSCYCQCCKQRYIISACRCKCPCCVREILHFEVAHVPLCSYCQCCKQRYIILACRC